MDQLPKLVLNGWTLVFETLWK